MCYVGGMRAAISPGRVVTRFSMICSGRVLSFWLVILTKQETKKKSSGRMSLSFPKQDLSISFYETSESSASLEVRSFVNAFKRNWEDALKRYGGYWRREELDEELDAFVEVVVAVVVVVVDETEEIFKLVCFSGQRWRCDGTNSSRIM